MKIGFIGLGVMGKNMAANLINKGHNLKVTDLNKDAVNELKKMGAEEGHNASDVAAESDIIFTSLPNSQIVEGVVTGKGGVLEGAKEGTIYIDLSSITPKTIRNIAKKASEKGVKVLDAPVSGGVAGAQKGTLTIMVGGDEEAFNKALPVLNCIGTKVFHVGDIRSTCIRC